MEKAGRKGLVHVDWARRKAEAIRVSTRRDVVKHNQKKALADDSTQQIEPRKQFEPYETKRVQPS